MDPKIRNFKALEKFSQEHRRETLDLIETWEEFAQENPEVLRFQTAEEFYEYAKQNPQKNIDTSIWVAKELRDAQPYVRQEVPPSANQENNKQNSIDLMGALGVSTLLASAVMNKPKIIEEDGRYLNIYSELRKKWLKENPGKDFLSKEGLDYLYGSLEDKDGSFAHKEAERIFRENPKNSKRMEKYDREKTKVYKNPQDDPRVRHHEYVIWEHAKARYYLLKKTDSSVKFDSVLEQIKNKTWEDFALAHPEKAEVYAQKHREIRKAYELIKTRPVKEETSIQEQLEDYRKTSGKEIKYVEKTHRPEDISQEEATRRLERITPPREDKYTIKPPQKEEKEEKKKEESLYEKYRRFRNLKKSLKSELQLKPPKPRIPKTGGIRTGARTLGRVGAQAGRTVGRAAAKIGAQVARGAAQAAGKAGMMAGQGVVAGAMWVGAPVLIAIAAVIILIIIVIVLSGGMEGQNDPKHIPSYTYLDYSIPFRDKTIMPSDPESAKKFILTEFPKAKLEYWDAIVKKSVEYDWNPAFVLTLWIEETGASHFTIEKNGGGNDGSISPTSLGHIGCAPWENQTIDESLRCLFINFSQISKENFEKFMRRYSGEGQSGAFTVNPDFPERIKKYYSMLVPLGGGMTTPPPRPGQITPTTPPVNFIYYCQGDPKWGNTCNLSMAGCGPTSMAMVLTAFGETILPPAVDDIFRERGWRSCGDSPSIMPSAITTLLPEKGFTIRSINSGEAFNLETAKNYLNNGYLIIGSTANHIFVVDSVNVENNTVHLQDPDARCSYPNGYDSSASTPWRGESWYYAYAVKKL